MIVRELMSAPVQNCQSDTDLAAVTQLMWHHDCGFVPVVDASGHVAGVITDRDVCIAAGTRRQLTEHIAASQAMSQPVHACLPDDTIDDVLATMKQFRVRRLAVIDANGRLQGVVSLNDVVRAVGKKGGPTAASIVATLASICAPRSVTVAVT
jgi:CBS domain-containing protein